MQECTTTPRRRLSRWGAGELNPVMGKLRRAERHEHLGSLFAAAIAIYLQDIRAIENPGLAKGHPVQLGDSYRSATLGKRLTPCRPSRTMC